jgi:AraC-like DNA-binding protein
VPAKSAQGWLDNWGHFRDSSAAAAEDRDLTTAHDRRQTGKQGFVEGAVHVGPLLPVPALLNELGVDADELLASVGIEPLLLSDADNLMTFATAGRLLRECVARTACDHFGLLVGERGGPASLGLLGTLLLHSANAGSALQSLVTHLDIRDRGAVPTLTVEGKGVTLGYVVYERGVKSVDQIADIAIAIGCNILRSLCGAAWVPSEVLLAHRRPADVRPYRRFFRAPVRFDAGHNGLVFPSKWLARPLTANDPHLRQKLQDQVHYFDAIHGMSFAAKMRRTLRAAVTRGTCSVTQAAQIFNMSRRTLSRRLRAEGTTYEALLNEVRYEVACQLLGHTDMLVRDVAETLDYADAAAFTRAFCRWSGTTPARWRAGAPVGATSQGGVSTAAPDG